MSADDDIADAKRKAADSELGGVAGCCANGGTIRAEVDNAKSEHIPLVDNHWADDHLYKSGFYMVDRSLLGTVREKEWQKGMLDGVLADVNRLRSLPHNVFWSTVKSKPHVLQFIDSFLKACPRLGKYDQVRTAFDRHSCIYRTMRELYKAFFLLIIRLFTRRESTTEFLSGELYAQIVRDCEVLTISRLMNIAITFGKDNSELLVDSFRSLFKTQPLYWNDLESYFKASLDFMDETAKYAKFSMSDGSRFNMNLRKSTKHFMELYLARSIDFALTFLYFVKVLSEAAPVMHRSGVTDKLPAFAEEVYGAYLTVYSRPINSFFFSVRHFGGQLELFKTTCVRLYHKLLTVNFPFDPSLDELDGNCERAQSLIGALTQAISYREFISAYNVKYPLVVTAEKMVKRKLCDKTQTEYFANAIKEVEEQLAKSKDHRRANFSNRNKTDGRKKTSK